MADNKKRMRSRNRIVGIGALMALVAALVPASLLASGKDNGAATGRVAAGWTSLDIQTSTANSNGTWILPTYDRLIGYDKNLKPTPYVASSWKVTPATRPKQVVFQIRKGVKCSDGTPVTPSVIKASFDRLITVPKIGTNRLTGLFGPGPYKTTANNKKGTFTFSTGTPAANLLIGFADSVASIICPAGLANASSLASNMYGSGPYTVQSITPGDSVVYKLRPEWKWGPNGTTSKTLPSTLTYRIMADSTTAANAILTGLVNFTVNDITGVDGDRLAGQKSLVHRKAQVYHTVTLTFNMFPGRITTDQTVREALSEAVKPADWYTAAYGGHGLLSDMLNPPGTDCYTNSLMKYMPTGNLAKARQILTSGGWTFSNGHWDKGGTRLKVKVLSSPGLLGGAGQYVAAQYQSLGVDVELADLPTSTYVPAIVGANFDVTFQTSQVVTPAPGQDLTSYSGAPIPKGVNIANVGIGDNPYQQAALRSSLFAGDKRCQYLQQFNKIALQKKYFVPLAAPTSDMWGNGWDFNPAVNIVFQPTGLFKLKK